MSTYLRLSAAILVAVGITACTGHQSNESPTKGAPTTKAPVTTTVAVHTTAAVAAADVASSLTTVQVALPEPVLATTTTVDPYTYETTDPAFNTPQEFPGTKPADIAARFVVALLHVDGGTIVELAHPSFGVNDWIAADAAPSDGRVIATTALVGAASIQTVVVSVAFPVLPDGTSIEPVAYYVSLLNTDDTWRVFDVEFR